MFRRLRLVAILPFAIIAGIFLAIYSIFVPPRDKNSRSSKECKPVRWTCMLCSKVLTTPGYQCEKCKEDALETPRIKLQDLPQQGQENLQAESNEQRPKSDVEFCNQLFQGAIFIEFPPLDPPEDPLRTIEREDAEFAADRAALHQFLTEQDEEWRKEAEVNEQIDKEIDALKASMGTEETHVPKVDEEEYESS